MSAVVPTHRKKELTVWLMLDKVQPRLLASAAMIGYLRRARMVCAVLRALVLETECTARYLPASSFRPSLEMEKTPQLALQQLDSPFIQSLIFVPY